MVFLGVLGAAILAGMIYLAISPKSDLKVRIAALCALGLMVVSVIVCMLTYVKAKATPKQLLLPDMEPSDLPPPPPATENLHMIIMFIALIIAIFVMVVVFSLKEQAKISGKKEVEETGWE